jgi:hypothetical protein
LKCTEIWRWRKLSDQKWFVINEAACEILVKCKYAYKTVKLQMIFLYGTMLLEEPNEKNNISSTVGDGSAVILAVLHGRQYC